MPQARNIDHFVGALQRRLGMGRGIERVGVLLTFGCAAAAIAIPLGVLLGASALWLTLWILSASIALGMIAAWRAWPTRLTAAIEGDRQFKLDDLLSTAWSIRRTGAVTDNSAAALLLHEARTACQTRSAKMLVTRRWGMARWVGLAIGVALVLTASAWWSVADSSGVEVAGNVGGGFLTPKELRHERPTSSQRIERGATPESRGETKTGEQFPDGTSSPQTGDSTQPLEDASSQADAHAGGGEGAGMGSAQTESRPTSPTALVGSQAATGADRATGLEEVSGVGGGRQSDEVNRDNEAESGEAGIVSDSVGHPAPPWASPHWRQDQSAATAAMRQGRVPDAYLDLVRAYFDQEPRTK